MVHSIIRSWRYMLHLKRYNNAIGLDELSNDFYLIVNRENKKKCFFQTLRDCQKITYNVLRLGLIVLLIFFWFILYPAITITKIFHSFYIILHYYCCQNSNYIFIFYKNIVFVLKKTTKAIFLIYQ